MLVPRPPHRWDGPGWQSIDGFDGFRLRVRQTFRYGPVIGLAGFSRRNIQAGGGFAPLHSPRPLQSKRTVASAGERRPARLSRQFCTFAGNLHIQPRAPSTHPSATKASNRTNRDRQRISRPDCNMGGSAPRWRPAQPNRSPLRRLPNDVRARAFRTDESSRAHGHRTAPRSAADRKPFCNDRACGNSHQWQGPARRCDRFGSIYPRA